MMQPYVKCRFFNYAIMWTFVSTWKDNSFFKTHTHNRSFENLILVDWPSSKTMFSLFKNITNLEIFSITNIYYILDGWKCNLPLIKVFFYILISYLLNTVCSLIKFMILLSIFSLSLLLQIVLLLFFFIVKLFNVIIDTKKSYFKSY